jgi:hypothetical protein
MRYVVELEIVTPPGAPAPDKWDFAALLGEPSARVIGVTEAREPSEPPRASGSAERADGEKLLDVNAGRSCPRCFGRRIIDKGGSCLKCADCQFDLGCGGS